MLVKTTAPRAQPRRAGSVAIRQDLRPRRAAGGRPRRTRPGGSGRRGVGVAGAGAGRCRTSSPGGGDSGAMRPAAAAPPAGLPASGCRDGMRLARGPPPGPYERLAPPGQWRIRQPCYRLRHACRAARRRRVRQLSADRAHRRPLDGAGPAPRRRPRDPTDPRRCHRYRAHGHHAGGPDRPGDDAPARTAGCRGRRGAGARDDDRRGHAQRARSARHPGRSSGPPAHHRRGTTTSAETVWCP